MPRLPVVDPANATGKAKEIFDGPLKGKHFNLFKGLANSQAGLPFYLNMNAALKEGGLTQKEGEAIALAISEANGCGYCVAAHTALGKMAGLSEAQTISARKGRIDDDPKLGALVRFAMALHEKKGFVSDADLAAFRKAGYTEGNVVEVVACYALTVVTNSYTHVNDSEIDFPEAPALG